MKLIILDRDGVINIDSDEYIKSPEEWQAIPGSLEAMARLHRNGYHVVVASNQAGIARGKFNIDTLNGIHQKMLTHANQYGAVVHAIFFCPHGPDDGCSCRKPEPGLLLEVASRLKTSLKKVYCVGDKLSDIHAAKAAGGIPVLVKTGYGQKVVDNNEVPDGIAVYTNLADFVENLCKKGR